MANVTIVVIPPRSSPRIWSFDHGRGLSRSLWKHGASGRLENPLHQKIGKDTIAAETSESRARAVLGPKFGRF